MTRNWRQFLAAPLLIASRFDDNPLLFAKNMSDDDCNENINLLSGG